MDFKDFLYRDANWNDFSNFTTATKKGYMKSIYLYRSIKLIADSFVDVEFNLYSKKDNSIIEEHSILDLLNNPNSEMTFSDLKEIFVIQKMLAGEAFWYLAGKDIKNNPGNIYPIRPDLIEEKTNNSGKLLGWDINNNGFKEKSSVLQWKNYNPTNRYRGLSPLQVGSDAVDTSNEIVEWNKKFFEQGLGIPPGVFTTTDSIRDFEESGLWSKLMKLIKKKFTGTKNAHKPLILTGDLKWVEMGKSHKDLDFEKLKNMTDQDICNVLGVPALLIKTDIKPTYNNLQTAKQIFWEQTMLPLITDFLDKINKNLIKDKEMYLGFDKGNIEALQESKNDKAKRLSELVKNNIMTINDARKSYGLEEIEGADIFVSELKQPPSSLKEKSYLEYDFEEKKKTLQSEK